MLSRATADPRVRLWLTDMAIQYVHRADQAASFVASMSVASSLSAFDELTRFETADQRR